MVDRSLLVVIIYILFVSWLRHLSIAYLGHIPLALVIRWVLESLVILRVNLWLRQLVWVSRRCSIRLRLVVIVTISSYWLVFVLLAVGLK